ALAPPRAPRSLPYREFFKQNRKAPLQYFGVGQARIRHMGLHGVGAIKIETSTGASGDGFVILIALIAEGEIVHRALCGRHRAESSEESICHGLARLDISSDHGSGIFWCEHAAFGDDDFYGLEA